MMNSTRPAAGMARLTWCVSIKRLTAPSGAGAADPTAISDLLDGGRAEDAGGPHHEDEQEQGEDHQRLEAGRRRRDRLHDRRREGDGVAAGHGPPHRAEPAEYGGDER